MHDFSFHDRGALANLIGRTFVSLWGYGDAAQVVKGRGGRSAGLSSPSSLLWQCSWSTRPLTAVFDQARGHSQQPGWVDKVLPQIAS